MMRTIKDSSLLLPFLLLLRSRLILENRIDRGVLPGRGGEKESKWESVGMGEAKMELSESELVPISLVGEKC